MKGFDVQYNNPKIDLKLPEFHSMNSIYLWAGYEFCLTKDVLNEKTLKDLRKKYSSLKDLPVSVDYNSIHSACSLHAEYLRGALKDYREFLLTTQFVSPAKFESLFNFIHRVQKLKIKNEKNDDRS